MRRSRTRRLEDAPQIRRTQRRRSPRTQQEAPWARPSSSKPSAPRSASATAGCRACKATEMLRHAQVEVVKRAGIDPARSSEVIGGCVTQAGEQGSQRHPQRLAVGRQRPARTRPRATTVDAQCGSAQQANHLVAGLIAAGGADVGIACGVEAMSHVGLGANVINGPGQSRTDAVALRRPAQRQFGAAERIADNRGITREDLDEWGFHSQRKAKAPGTRAGSSARSSPIEAPVIGDDGRADRRDGRLIGRDQGLRETTMEGLAKLKPVVEGYKHTAGNVVADLRRRRRRALDGRGQGQGARAQAAGPPRAPARHGHRPLLPARRPGRRRPRRCSNARGWRWPTSTCSRSTRRSPRSCCRWAQVHKPDLDRVQRERRRHRARPPGRLDRAHA